MASNNTAVYGMFKTRGQVDSAVERMKADGFRDQDISVLFPDKKGTSEFAHEANTKAPEGAAGGAGAGAIVGGTLGLLAGIGLLAIPGLRYEGMIKEGHILLSVHSDNSDWTKKAKTILENAGATDISSTGEAKADYPKA